MYPTKCYVLIGLSHLVNNLELQDEDRGLASLQLCESQGKAWLLERKKPGYFRGKEISLDIHSMLEITLFSLIFKLHLFLLNLLSP